LYYVVPTKIKKLIDQLLIIIIKEADQITEIMDCHINLMTEDVLRLHLFRLEIQDVINFIKTSVKAKKISNDPTFWRDYVIHNSPFNKETKMTVDIQNLKTSNTCTFHYCDRTTKFEFEVCIQTDWNEFYQAIINKTFFYYKVSDYSDNAITIMNNEFIYDGDESKYTCSLDRCADAFTFVNDSLQN
jgi:hypothetical protein